MIQPLPLLAAERGQDQYEKRIRPLLVKYCGDCHSDGVAKGDYAFDEYADYTSLLGDFRAWDHLRQQVATHVMPPEKKDKPSLVERDEIVAWIEDTIFWTDPAKPDPGHVTARRLNRTEYNNTVRDLLYLDTRPADQFPPDDTGYGFDNIGDVLSLSPILMEKCVRAAGDLSAAALKVKPADKMSVVLDAGKFWNHKGATTETDAIRWFYNDATAATKFTAPVAGTYDLTLSVSAAQAGTESARMVVQISEADTTLDLGSFDVKSEFAGPKTKWQMVVVPVRVSAGEHRIYVRFANDFADPAEKNPARRDRNLAVKEVRVSGPRGLMPPQPGRFLTWLLDGKSAGLPGVALSGEDFQKGEGTSVRDTGSILLAGNGSVKVPLEITEVGKYRIVIKAGAQQAGTDFAQFDVDVAGQKVGPFSIKAKDQAPEWFTTEIDLPVGKHELAVRFLNDFYDEKTHADRNLWVHQARVEGPLTAQVLGEADVVSMTLRMAERLFRRPLNDEQKKMWTGLASSAVKEGEAPLDALGLMLEGILISPSFLFHAMPSTIGEAKNGSALIDEFSLAERLSYFLWSAPPDARLLDLAAKGQLRQQLTPEVQRMVQDWRAWALTENFAGQWLQLRDMDIVSRDTRQFPEFKGGIAYAMKRETQMFFNHILRGNRSVLEFLDGDYTFVNERLARFYGLSGAKGKGDTFVEVSLKGTPRKGVLTQGSILTLTSNPTRTSPVKRGKFLLENILGTPPPPAPGGVPPLDEKKVRQSGLTLREQFAEHRSNASCAGCHAFLDPMGFAFENYDAVGRWRDQEKGHAIDATGSLVRGQQFKDLQDLVQILTRDLSGEVITNLAEHLLTYALGRGPSYADRHALDEIVSKTRKAGDGLQSMVIAICESVPFQRVRVGDR
ncbi:MAG: DUF1592 domain-containing protein [Verrucomicrobiales bacterium]|nr:DUF1592 domain-containing protein [Verrucomicrobiales bacterium]MCP5556352.1 DUF1592 domain-containing protein [Verrucomicrobiaceae bacterium]